MGTLDNVLQQLRQEHKQAQGEVQKLEKAISAIEALTGHSLGVAAKGTRPKRTMSVAARRKIAQAQRARWAKSRKQGAISVKRRLSPEGRKRIAAAARARWARVKAQQGKKAA
jgi:hypothetical protein